MLIKIENTPEFSEFLGDNITPSDYRYKYLINVLEAVFRREVEVDKNSFIFHENDGWIIYVEIKTQVFIYGHNYSETHINQFKKNIDLNEYEEFEIMGTFDLVYRIIGESGLEKYSIIKDRYFYELTNYKYFPAEDEIELADYDSIEELVLMFQNYYIEEYKGERNKSREYLVPMIEKYIENDSLYVLKKGNEMTAFCSMNNPDIGIIFTKEKFRQQGIGRRLLEFCSSLLYDQNEVVYLMTDMHNPASNAICKKIGYDLIYQHTNIKL